MRPIDADALREKFADVLCSTYTDDYAKGFVNGLYAALNMPTITQPSEPLPVLVNDEPDREYIDYICPRCKEIISQRRHGQRMETVYQCRYHDNCGQRVDWSSPQSYRRPPEGEEAT